MVGALFGNFRRGISYYGMDVSETLREANSMVLDRRKDLWLPLVRRFVLGAAASWFPEHRGVLVIKKPNGSVGLPVEAWAEWYGRNMGVAVAAHEAHLGPKAVVRYEDLVAEAEEAMRRLYADLGVAVPDEDLRLAVEKHAWHNVPPGKQGEGRFIRKGTPGAWREDLTPEQARTVGEATRLLVGKFYPEL